MNPPHRRTAFPNARRQQLAQQGEMAAQSCLVAKGYSVLGQNVRIGPWEIDIICGDGDEIVFVEVKTTSASDRYFAEERVSQGQQQRLFRAAERWLADRRLFSRPARFDLVVVEWRGDDEPLVHHHIDALRRDDTRAS